MELPEKEWYTVQEVARRWNCSLDDVLHCLYTGIIYPSFYLKRVKCSSTPWKDEDHSKDISVLTGLFSPLSDQWNCNNDEISTNSQWELDLQKCYLALGSPKLPDFDENEEFKKVLPVVPTIKTINDIYISTPELHRFEALTSQGTAQSLKSSNSNGGEHMIPDKPLHPREKKTLLTIVASLLDVITGEYCKDFPKHPSIKNQADLITKLVELETAGLSKSNLEKYFAMAKKVARGESE